MKRNDCSINRLPLRNMPEETKNKTREGLAQSVSPPTQERSSSENRHEVMFMSLLTARQQATWKISQVILQHNFGSAEVLPLHVASLFIVVHNLYQCHLPEVIRFISNFTSSSSTSRIGPFDLFRLQSYNRSLQSFFGLPIVLLPCGL